MDEVIMSLYREDILNIYRQDLPWNKLSGTNILVTGATGLIGGCLVETLMMNPKRDYHLYASGRNEQRARERFKDYADDKAFHFVRYDVLEPLDSDVCFDYIIHAASNANPKFYATQPVEVMKANINGVSNLISYGLEHNMKRFLYVSSGEVYGEGDGRVLRRIIVAMWIVRSRVLVIPLPNGRQKLFVLLMLKNLVRMW